MIHKWMGVAAFQQNSYELDRHAESSGQIKKNSLWKRLVVDRMQDSGPDTDGEQVVCEAYLELWCLY